MMLSLTKHLLRTSARFNRRRCYSTHKYGLYLIFEDQVADAPPKIAIEKAVAGGVTMVQIREKKKSTSQFIKEAREIKAQLRGSNVPLIINDLIDVALACDADGVHVGQTDMSIEDARKILGPNKIIGCTVSNLHQAKLALFHGADYLVSYCALILDIASLTVNSGNRCNIPYCHKARKQAAGARDVQGHLRFDLVARRSNRWCEQKQRPVVYAGWCCRPSSVCQHPRFTCEWWLDHRGE